jgi:hypothetical protein
MGWVRQTNENALLAIVNTMCQRYLQINLHCITCIVWIVCIVVSVRSLAEALDMVRKQVKVTPKGQWVRVVGGW